VRARRPRTSAPRCRAAAGPTTYNSVTYRELDGAVFKLVIVANYGVRSIVNALEGTFEAGARRPGRS